MEYAYKFSTDKQPISISGKVSKNIYQLEITNTGTGMTDFEIANVGIFKQFNRNILNQEGNGLGLAIAKRIIKIFGGELRIASRSNAYTSVTLEFKTGKK